MSGGLIITSKYYFQQTKSCLTLVYKRESKIMYTNAVRKFLFAAAIFLPLKLYYRWKSIAIFVLHSN